MVVLLHTMLRVYIATARSITAVSLLYTACILNMCKPVRKRLGKHTKAYNYAGVVA
jgi:hypothetical protein